MVEIQGWSQVMAVRKSLAMLGTQGWSVTVKAA